MTVYETGEGQLSVETRESEETEALAGALATWADAAESIWLLGEIGSGKTTFSRGFIHALGYSGNVKSPTYTLIECYPECLPQITHFDCYRLSNAREFTVLGASTYFDNSLCLIEWPEQVVAALPPPSLKIFFTHLKVGRRLRLEPQNNHWQERLAQLAAERTQAHCALRGHQLPTTPRPT